MSLCPRRLLLYAGEVFTLTPLPFDSQGEPVHGLAFGWGSSEPAIAEVASDGAVTALKPGKCFVTASVGSRTEKVLVEVRDGKRPSLSGAQWDAEHANDCNNPEQSPDDSAITQSSVSNMAALAAPKHPSLPAVIIEPEDPVGIGSAGSAANATGHPRFTANLQLQSSAASTDNQLSSNNFNFTIPIFSSEGRGVGVGLSLSYNSRLWTKDEAARSRK